MSHSKQLISSRMLRRPRVRGWVRREGWIGSRPLRRFRLFSGHRMPRFKDSVRIESGDGRNRARRIAGRSGEFNGFRNGVGDDRRLGESRKSIRQRTQNSLRRRFRNHRRHQSALGGHPDFSASNQWRSSCRRRCQNHP